MDNDAITKGRLAIFGCLSIVFLSSGCVPAASPDDTGEGDGVGAMDVTMDATSDLDSASETGNPPDTPMERDLPRDVPEGHDMDAGPACDAICVPCCEEGSGEYVGCAPCTWEGNQCSEGTYWCPRGDDARETDVDAEAGSG